MRKMAFEDFILLRKILTKIKMIVLSIISEYSAVSVIVNQTKGLGKKEK